MADEWNGEPLSRASQLQDNEPIHYRIHDADGAGLLAFGTARPGASGWLDIAGHYREVQGAHPGQFLVLRRYNAPAGPAFERRTGPASLASDDRGEGA